MTHGRSTVGRSGSFGGAWTDIKLDKVSSYLAAYVKVLKNTPFTTMYVDAFAGTGFMKPIRVESGLFTEERETVPAGSARLALDVSPPFSRYLFVEKSRSRHQQLTTLRTERPDLKIDCEREDANAVLQALCRDTDWTRTRAVVFLDPYGMQVEWATIEALGRTKAVDLWYLVPTGIPYQRMMPRRKRPRPEWEARLDRAFGDNSWRRFYEESTEHDLIEGERVTVARTGGIRDIEAYVMDRLRSAFHAVSPSIGKLHNSKGQLYSLVFCCGNPRAEGVAMKIANHVLAQE